LLDEAGRLDVFSLAHPVDFAGVAQDQRDVVQEVRHFEEVQPDQQQHVTGEFPS